MRYEDAKNLWEAAYDAALAAGNGNKPVPMVVQEHQNMADDDSPVVYQEVVPDGVCGFAWVQWLKKDKLADEFCKLVRGLGRTHESNLSHEPNMGKGYPAMWKLWVGEYNQSMSRKEAFAKAFCAKIQSAGINCSYSSRMD